jgi:hypothetical protein
MPHTRKLAVFFFIVALVGCTRDDEQLANANKTITDLRETIKVQNALIGRFDGSIASLKEQVEKTVSACADKRNQSDMNSWFEKLHDVTDVCNKAAASSRDVAAKLDSMQPPPQTPQAPPQTPQPPPQIPQPPPQQSEASQQRPAEQQPTQTQSDGPIDPDKERDKDPDKERAKNTEKQLLLIAAFIACEYYSAGTCKFVVAAVGIRLGLSEGEVRTEAPEAFKTAKLDVEHRGVSVPGPDGRPIILKPKDAVDVVDLRNAYRALPPEDQRNVCKVAELLRHSDLVGRLLSPVLAFPSVKSKQQALEVALKIDPSLGPVVNAIPVGDHPLLCG